MRLLGKRECKNLLSSNLVIREMTELSLELYTHNDAFQVTNASIGEVVSVLKVGFESSFFWKAS